MPLLGKTSKQVLPPIKNPVFSLTEATSVVVSEQGESSKSNDGVCITIYCLLYFAICLLCYIISCFSYFAYGLQHFEKGRFSELIRKVEKVDNFAMQWRFSI